MSMQGNSVFYITVTFASCDVSDVAINLTLIDILPYIIIFNYLYDQLLMSDYLFR